MGTKKKKTDKGDTLTTLTDNDIEELKSEDGLGKDLITDEIEEAEQSGKESQPIAVPGQSLSAFNVKIKKRLKAEGKSTRVMDTDAQRKNAVSRLVTALNKRGWVAKGVGIYELKEKHRLSLDAATFEATVDGYTLPLGKDALKTLDQYVTLSKVISPEQAASL